MIHKHIKFSPAKNQLANTLKSLTGWTNPFLVS